MTKIFSFMILALLSLSVFAGFTVPTIDSIRGDYQNILGEGAYTLQQKYQTISSGIDTSISSAISTASGNYLYKDGSVVMTGNLNMNGSAIVSVGNVDGVDVSALSTSFTAFSAKLVTGTSKPTCDADHRGFIYITEGGADVADAVEACVKNSSNAYAWISFVTVP